MSGADFEKIVLAQKRKFEPTRTTLKLVRSKFALSDESGDPGAIRKGQTQCSFRQRCGAEVHIQIFGLDAHALREGILKSAPTVNSA